MTNFSIGPNPLQIIGAGVDNAPLTVQNTGAVSIYISGDPGVSPNAFEYKIDAGGDFIWPPTKPLSVCTGPGLVGQISYGGTGDVHVNSGSTNVTGAVTINGSVPIAGPVTVTGTVALSGGTVALSGPVAISGGVSVTGSTINVGNAIALANTPVQIYSVNMTIGVGAGTYSSVLSTTVLIKSYASILVVISNTSNSGAVFPIVPTNYVALTLSCADSGGGGRSSVYSPQWLYVTQGNGPPNTPYQQSLQIPVTNTNMNIQTNVTVGANFDGHCQITVYGMGQIITSPQYISDGDGFTGTIPEGGVFSVQNGPAAATAIYYVSSKNGVAFGSAINLTGTTASGLAYLEILCLESGVLQRITSLITLGIPQQANVANMYFPMRPIYARIVTASPNYIGSSITQY